MLAPPHLPSGFFGQNWQGHRTWASRRPTEGVKTAGGPSSARENKGGKDGGRVEREEAINEQVQNFKLK